MDRALQLLERNQPEKALEIVQKFMALFPDNPELLSLAGQTHQVGAEPAVRMQLWRRIFEFFNEHL